MDQYIYAHARKGCWCWSWSAVPIVCKDVAIIRVSEEVVKLSITELLTICVYFLPASFAQLLVPSKKKLTSWQTKLQSLLKTRVLLPNLCDGNFSLISGTDKLPTVLGKWHHILRVNEHNESRRRSYLGHVLMLLNVGNQSQTYTAYYDTPVAVVVADTRRRHILR